MPLNLDVLVHLKKSQVLPIFKPSKPLVKFSTSPLSKSFNMIVPSNLSRSLCSLPQLLYHFLLHFLPSYLLTKWTYKMRILWHYWNRVNPYSWYLTFQIFLVLNLCYFHLTHHLFTTPIIQRKFPNKVIFLLHLTLLTFVSLGVHVFSNIY